MVGQIFILPWLFHNLIIVLLVLLLSVFFELIPLLLFNLLLLFLQFLLLQRMLTDRCGGHHFAEVSLHRLLVV